MKRIEARVEIGPNYIYHVLAVCRVNFDSEYADRYAGSVAADDIATIRRFAPELTFGGGRAGAFIDLVVGAPLAAGLSTSGAFADFYRRLEEAIAAGTHEEFIEHFHLGISSFSPWFGVEPDDLAGAVPCRAALAEIGRVFADNFYRYETAVWPGEEPEIRSVAGRIDAEFRDWNVIEQWEDVTRISFKRAVFHPVLCSAIARGPNANSYSYEHVVFWHMTEPGKLHDLIVHEIGTHILIEPFRELLATGSYERQAAYHAYECLSRHYTARILGRPPRFQLRDYEQERFSERIAEIERSGEPLSAMEMLAAMLRQ